MRYFHRSPSEPLKFALGMGFSRQCRKIRRVQNAHLAVQQIVGNRAGAEIHGQDHKQADDLPALQVGIDQRISGKYGQYNGQHGADHGQQRRPAQGVDILVCRIVQHLVVRFQVPSLRPEEYILVDKRVRCNMVEVRSMKGK